MKITLVYNFPAFGQHHDSCALRFVRTYAAFPPGIEHEVVVISNGGPVTSIMRDIIEKEGHFPNLRWFERSNEGKDLGGFQEVSEKVPADWFVFFGGSIFFWKAGWLKRIAESIEACGETLYGTMAGGSNLSQAVYPHIRTTGFWTTPKIMNAYPHKAKCDNDRYEMEHRENCLTMWAEKNGFIPKVVTWDAIYDIPQWVSIKDGFHISDQSGLLFKDRLCESPWHEEIRSHA
jgi:hypothetical protein